LFVVGGQQEVGDSIETAPVTNHGWTQVSCQAEAA